MDFDRESIKRSLRIKKARNFFRAKGFPVIDLSARFQSGEITEAQLKNEVFKLISELHLEDASIEFRNAIKEAQEANMQSSVLVHDAENFITDFAEEELKKRSSPSSS